MATTFLLCHGVDWVVLSEKTIADETVLGGEWGVRVVGGSSVFKLPSVYTAIGVVYSDG